MSNKIYHLRSSTKGKEPSGIDIGTIAINTYDGKLFVQQVQDDVTKTATFLNSEYAPYTLDSTLSSIHPQYGSNNITGEGSTIINGIDNTIQSNNSFVAGSNNTTEFNNVNILGSNIIAVSSNFTYVNNLSTTQNIAAAGDIYTSGMFVGDGSRLINVPFAPGVVQVNYSQILSDTQVNKTLEVSSVSSIALTLPLDTTATINNGSQFIIIQLGPGDVTLLAEEGVELVGATVGSKIRSKGSVVLAKKIDANKWNITGDVYNTVGKYWYSSTEITNTDTWHNLANWYVNEDLTITAQSLPNNVSDVVISGAYGPYVDLDREGWVEPRSITCLYSTTTFHSSANTAASQVSLAIRGHVVFTGTAASTASLDPITGPGSAEEPLVLGVWEAISTYTAAGPILSIGTSGIFTGWVIDSSLLLPLHFTNGIRDSGDPLSGPGSTYLNAMYIDPSVGIASWPTGYGVSEDVLQVHNRDFTGYVTDNTNTWHFVRGYKE